MKKLTTFEDHLDKQYGRKGTKKRERFEYDSLAFRLGEMLIVFFNPSSTILLNVEIWISLFPDSILEM